MTRVRALSWILLLLLQCGCSVTAPFVPFQGNGRVWPDAPFEPRIMYVGEFGEPADLGIGLSTWARLVSFAAGDDRRNMQRPMSVAATEDGGVIFVADPDANCVHRYDLRRSKYHCLVLEKGHQAIFPVVVSVARDGWLFVADSQSGLLYQAAPGARNLEVFFASSPVRQPTGLFWDATEELLFVSDTADHCIKVFDRAGNFKYAIGRRGNEPGDFNYPTYIWIDAAKELLVTDSLNFRVQRLKKDGVPVMAFGEKGDRAGYFSRPKGVATDSFGHIYVVDALMHSIQIFNRAGELLLSLAEQGQGDGQFWLPSGIFIAEDNTIYVADSYNHRIQVFRYVGPES